jgi:hypothetical protein
MSETLLTFARPLLDQLPEPPTAGQLQSAMTIASLIWNVPEYERAGHPKAAEYRKALDGAVADMPTEGRLVIAAMTHERATTYESDPRVAFAEVVAEPNGKAEVRATAVLLTPGVAQRG